MSGGDISSSSGGDGVRGRNGAERPAAVPLVRVAVDPAATAEGDRVTPVVHASSDVVVMYAHH